MKTRVARGGRYLLSLCLMASAHMAAPARAQESGRESARGAATSVAAVEVPPAAAVSHAAAEKIDEFGRVGGCDHSARLDNFAIALQNEPGALGYVIVYGPEGEGGGSGRSRLHVTQDYLVQARGLDAARLRMVYGGRYKSVRESASELWLVPPGAAPPVPTTHYDNELYSFTGMFAEQGVWDSISYYNDAGTGPPVGNAAEAAFADMLRTRPDTRAYLVVYHGADSTPGTWRRVGAREAAGLTSNHGVASDRVSVIFGGYRKEEGEGAVQLWILPANAPPPVAPATETMPLKTVQLGSFEDYELSDEDNARYVFKGFADLLREDADLRAYVIVRTAAGGKEGGEPAAESPAEPTGPQPAVSGPAPAEGAGAPPEAADVVRRADLLRLVEKWKKDLAEQYGIGEERLVVLVAPARDELSAGQLETWLVPRGADPPDPDAAEEGVGAEEWDGEGEEPAEPAEPESKDGQAPTPPARRTL